MFLHLLSTEQIFRKTLKFEHVEDEADSSSNILTNIEYDYGIIGRL